MLLVRVQREKGVGAFIYCRNLIEVLAAVKNHYSVFEQCPDASIIQEMENTIMFSDKGVLKKTLHFSELTEALSVMD